VNVWQDASLSDCDVSQKFVELLIVSNSELQMARDDTSLFVVTSGVAGKFENLGRKVLQDSSEIDWSAGTDTLRIIAFS
jgi:hypothetical protein